jgi:carbon-monoxide dehydrogenase large subunit
MTVGSRSVQLAGSAIASACTVVVERARERAADRFEAAVADVVLDAATGRFHVAGTPARTLGWSDLVASGPWLSRSDEISRAQNGVLDEREPLAAEVDHVPSTPTFPFGVHVAVVEVDTETGGVRLRQMVALDDAGRILNPLLADGQVHGGIAQGVAQALLEAVRYDGEGQPLTTNLTDYLAVSAAELPSFDLVRMETPTFANELGAKGIGESGTVGSIPAVYNAVVDALGHRGVRHLETPLTPERIWAALRR